MEKNRREFLNVLGLGLLTGVAGLQFFKTNAGLNIVQGNLNVVESSLRGGLAATNNDLKDKYMQLLVTMRDSADANIFLSRMLGMPLSLEDYKAMLDVAYQLVAAGEDPFALDFWDKVFHAQFPNLPELGPEPTPEPEPTPAPEPNEEDQRDKKDTPGNA